MSPLVLPQLHQVQLRPALLQEEVAADVDAIVERQHWLALKQEPRLTRHPWLCLSAITSAASDFGSEVIQGCPSFWQLDGQGDSEVDEEEKRKGEREEDGRVHCIFCNVLSKPKLVQPISFDSMNYYINTRSKLSIICTSCQIKGSDVGVCLKCQDIAYVNCNEWDRTCRPCMYALLAEEELSPNCSHSSNTAV